MKRLKLFVDTNRAAALHRVTTQRGAAELRMSEATVPMLIGPRASNSFRAVQ